MRALLVMLALLACAHAPPPSASAPPTGQLVLDCPHPDATVWIDDRLAGDCRELTGGLRLAPGFHRVEVRHDDHHPRYFEVDLPAGERVALDVTLVEALP